MQQVQWALIAGAGALATWLLWDSTSAEDFGEEDYTQEDYAPQEAYATQEGEEAYATQEGEEDYANQEEGGEAYPGLIRGGTVVRA